MHTNMKHIFFVDLRWSGSQRYFLLCHQSGRGQHKQKDKTSAVLSTINTLKNVNKQSFAQE